MTLRPPRTFWLPKAGNSPDEYEDASRVVYPQRFGAARIAVSDGASESAFAREWANILSDAFVTQPPEELRDLTEDSLTTWLAPAQEEWRSGVPWDRLPWHGQAKAEAGAFATLLGLVVAAQPDDPRRLSWRATAVGDSCLFIIRDGDLLLSFPLDDADQFGNNPALICSNPDNVGGFREQTRFHDGECATGDVFMLATDAVAAWLLAQRAAGEKPWETLAALDSSNWAGWIDEQRRGGSMRNDDTTLVIIEVG